MKLVGSPAGGVSARHSEGASVTAAIDEMVFRVPVRVGDVLHLRAQVNWAGRTSMEVGVRATADRWGRSVPPVHVASANVVLVAVDDDGLPRPVAPVLPETDEDHRRNAEARIPPGPPARPACRDHGVAHGRLNAVGGGETPPPHRAHKRTPPPPGGGLTPGRPRAGWAQRARIGG
ncbi:hotdog domain-containing protein, partial [Amycolatopsis sp. NPDC051061]|uniref:acyl-CoA thioesterase n=1 Tax=Amycolatopsis sp. NPDC051061 TaxID=3155042 RepID=UPI00343E8D70